MFRNQGSTAKPMAASMKLSIEPTSKRVVFAEADKECIDFLFQIFSLPIATVTSLLRKEGMKGSFPKLYKSLENLRSEYVQPSMERNTILQPVPVRSVPVLGLKHKDADRGSYRCNNCGYTHPDTDQSRCGCGVKRTKIVDLAADDGTLVKGEVTYMVTDDLEVKPMSTISTITLLNKFNVKEAGDLEERVVNFGMNEAVKLLKVSMETENVLTHVFC